MTTGRATDEDARRAKTLVLAGLASGRDVFDLAGDVRPLHPKNNTFPGEVFLSMAVDVLDAAEFGPDNPLEYEGLRERFLPEVQLRGRNDHRKSFYTLLTPPALQGASPRTCSARSSGGTPMTTGSSPSTP